jgi:hypothetical protein
MFYFTERHYLALSGRKLYYSQIILKNLSVGIIVFLISYFGFKDLAHSLISVIIGGGITVVLYLLIYWLFGFFEKEDVISIRKSFFSFFSK